MDTGNTLACLFEHLKSKGASSISVCTLLDKPSRRKVNVELLGEGKFYCGFEVISNILFVSRKVLHSGCNFFNHATYYSSNDLKAIVVI